MYAYQLTAGLLRCQWDTTMKKQMPPKCEPDKLFLIRLK